MFFYRFQHCREMFADTLLIFLVLKPFEHVSCQKDKKTQNILQTFLTWAYKKGSVMKHLRITSVIILLCSTVISLFFYGCEDKVLTSRWRNHEITIDGRDSEWGNFIQYYNEKYNVVLCMYNDENDLYLKVSTPDQTLQRQFLMLGFTVWFDPGGGKNKTLGIHFPKGMQSGAPGVPQPGRRNDRDAEVSAREKALKGELDILGPEGKESWKFSVDSAKELGIQIDFGTVSGILIYELRIPLRKNAQSYYAIGADMSAPIGIGCESGALDKEELKKMGSERENTRPGGMSGGTIGRNRSREGRGGVPGGPRRMLEPIDVWVKVMLAPKP